MTILTTESGRNHVAFDIVAADHDMPLRTIVMPDIIRATNSGPVALLASQLKLWKALTRGLQGEQSLCGI